MAAPSTAVTIALPILTLLAYLCHRATHRRPYNGIPYSPHSTRRLFGDMPELTTEAQRHRDPARMLLSQFERLGSPIIELFLMPFWPPLVQVEDTLEIENLLQNRLREFDKSPAHVLPFKPIVPGSSLAKVKGPERRAQLIELWRFRARVVGDRPVCFRDNFKIATYYAFWKALLGLDVNAVFLASGHGRVPPGTMAEGRRVFRREGAAQTGSNAIYSGRFVNSWPWQPAVLR
ncbi:hypothetical protein INS49_001428 [Diaporthe citri]|uniref:uncharacterized protein n=1 Tax=Diaporthe citri TaxID=83186 RepID=UPI001C7FF7D7|nr:uncharacterized protein INS49_001428 [Diaporthe citri]KAG6367243.1 hypothetical protein INS49_001428 [Diaporthe citri]